MKQIKSVNCFEKYERSNLLLRFLALSIYDQIIENDNDCPGTKTRHIAMPTKYTLCGAPRNDSC